MAGGYRAIDSMRVEKGYRVWGADITPDDTPYEAGLDFAVKLDKPGGFIGRDALVEAREAGSRKQLCCITLKDARSVALGNEPVRVDGEIVGRVTTGWLRLHGRALDRLRVPASRARGAWHRGRDGHLRQLGRGEVGERAAVRPGGERVRAPE